VSKYCKEKKATGSARTSGEKRKIVFKSQTMRDAEGGIAQSIITRERGKRKEETFRFTGKEGKHSCSLLRHAEKGKHERERGNRALRRQGKMPRPFSLRRKSMIQFCEKGIGRKGIHDASESGVKGWPRREKKKSYLRDRSAFGIVSEKAIITKGGGKIISPPL